MTTKVNGHVAGGESLTLALDFYTVTTTVNILVNGDAAGGTVTSQAALDKLVEIVSLRGQPVILSTPTVAGTGASAVYTFKFAVEHKGSWADATPDLPTTLGTAGIDYGFNTATNTVTINSML